MHAVPPDPLTRIRQVALNLGELRDELGGAVGPEAQTVLAAWRSELLEALKDLERLSAPLPDRGQPPGDDPR